MVQLTPEASDKVAGAVCGAIADTLPAIAACIQAWADAAKRVGTAAGRAHDAAAEWAAAAAVLRRPK